MAGQLELVAVADGSTEVLVTVAMVATGLLAAEDGGAGAGAGLEDAGTELVAGTMEVFRVVEVPMGPELCTAEVCKGAEVATGPGLCTTEDPSALEVATGPGLCTPGALPATVDTDDTFTLLADDTEDDLEGQVRS